MLHRMRTIALAALAVLGAMPAVGAHAQGCVLCYTSMAAASPSGLRAFQAAMFALLVPALLLFIALFLLIFRRRETADVEARAEA